MGTDAQTWHGQKRALAQQSDEHVNRMGCHQGTSVHKRAQRQKALCAGVGDVRPRSKTIDHNEAARPFLCQTFWCDELEQERRSLEVQMCRSFFCYAFG